MKTLMTRVALPLGLLLGLLMGSTAASASSAEDVVQCMRDNFPKTLSIRNIRLTTKDASGGESRLGGRVYAYLEPQAQGRDLVRATLILEEPRNMYGAAYLVLETDDYLRDGMFVYMPAVGRVRRISGSFADGPMMGTKFSYFEFKQMANAFGDLQGSYIKEESFEGRKNHLLKFTPMEGVDTRYTHVKAWIDAPSCLISKAEFYIGERLIKRMIA
ncbi:MAG: outer membrane lipoprotein-sorting protein, partial [Nevskiales bacterium]